MWIESHPDLANHPKTLKLCELLKVNKRTAIGLLHEFWWWCAAYTEDGDLRKYGMKAINQLMGLPCEDMSLIGAGFIDYRPHLRAHDWWDYYGRYLKLKYRNNAKKLMQIENLCLAQAKSRSGHAKDTLKSRLSAHTDVPVVTDVQELNQTDVTDVPARSTTSFASRSSQKTPGHVKGCTCEVCFAKVARI